MVSKFPYLGEYRSMKKTHKSFFFMSMIDNIIPVSIALLLPAVEKNTENGAPGNFLGPSYFETTLTIKGEMKNI